MKIEYTVYAKAAIYHLDLADNSENIVEGRNTETVRLLPPQV